MDNEKIPNFLAEQRESAPEDLQTYFLEFEDFWERKLWHELTNRLVDFFNHSASGPQRIPLFETFIKTFADKINQLKLVALGLRAAHEVSGKIDATLLNRQAKAVEDVQQQLSFLESLASRVNKPSSQDAYVYASVAAASIKLKLNSYQDARKDLDKAEAILDTFDSVETIVHACFYEVNADYYHARQEFASYYKNALLYLACVELSNLTPTELQTRAYDLSIAALVSESIYNFGELLLHPILDSLTNTPHDWLRELLFAFNRGDLSAYTLLEQHLPKNDLLKQHQQFLYQKLSLAALTETAFRRPPHDRTMAFADVAQNTNVREDEIEHLVMKALSLGLLRGTIDQVAKVARINWVQPKVLDMSQVEGMRGRLREWDASVNQLGNWIEGVGKDVWAA
ncbi:MAG: 26S proteasome regulatory subunit [Bogoriella megaspora]|nr:MAG: 26S proteasome regulatory subunit [Bogoriella megaspora]